MVQSGLLLIADITGYSTYINQSELEHARSSLTDLLNLLIAQTRLPLVISKLEGDAVFSYAPARSILQGQTVLEMVELTYAAFRQALELMIRNTTCTCTACRNLPNLDLKFFVHSGAFAEQTLGAYRELIGNDVNLVHRLAKNHIKEQTGLRAYAAYTQAAVDAFGLGQFAATLVPHREAFADVGEVQLYVQDLHGVWERRRPALRVVVRPEEALGILEVEFPLPPSLAWDYLTRPDLRNLFTGSTSSELTGTAAGRVQAGSVYVCAHGNSKSPHTVLDWQPFETYTHNGPLGFAGLSVHMTHVLTPAPGGTRLREIVSHVQGGTWYWRALFDFLCMPIIGRAYAKTLDAVRRRMVEDLAAGRIELLPPNTLDPQSAAAAAAAGLAEP
jgi:hypothetical protein